MYGKARHVAAAGRDASVPIERAEALEERPRARQHGGRRRIEPGERAGVLRPPARQLERERREVGFEDLRGRVRREARVRALAPGAITDPGRLPPGAPLTLLGRGAR